MGSFSLVHWVIVLAVVVLIFGTKKLRGMGADLGGALKGFRDGVRGTQPDSASSSDPVDGPKS